MQIWHSWTLNSILYDSNFHEIPKKTRNIFFCVLKVIRSICFWIWHWIQHDVITQSILSLGTEGDKHLMPFIFWIPVSLAQICFDWLYQLTFLSAARPEKKNNKLELLFWVIMFILFRYFLMFCNVFLFIKLLPKIN